MSRFKVGLGLTFVAVAAILIAIAMWPSHLSDSGRKGMEQGQADKSIAVREKNSSLKPAESDAVLRSFGEMPGGSERVLPNAPRMQSKQIKMH